MKCQAAGEAGGFGMQFHPGAYHFAVFSGNLLSSRPQSIDGISSLSALTGTPSLERLNRSAHEDNDGSVSIARIPNQLTNRITFDRAVVLGLVFR